ncbi:diphthine synthase [Candidatus Woesearchaeota archaeon]|nr:diphthine synthase [Nanoarchaeota archaeon]MCB9370965.1 diphthine synthase [Candidatus Woesearchaeota archaeon]USN44067.1 MAG: diphthine synthase [Candidatus Woesearchaeota archaeon]
MFHLIGIGYKIGHISVEQVEVIKNCKLVFLEYYTSFYENKVEELSEYLGVEIELADRSVVESQIEEKMLVPAQKDDVALLVMGDPLIATTHTDLLLRAREMELETSVLSNVSVANFITHTGLQFYKFGKITSIPFFSEKFMPRTPYLVFLDNFKMGAHSLFLLDLNPSNDVAYKGKSRFLRAHEALEFLLTIPKMMKENEELEEKDCQVLDSETHAVLCSRLGFSDEKIVYGTFEELMDLDKKEEFPEPLCLIVPGDLHEMEEKYLDLFRI